jgi:hypothetical protein
MEDNLTSGSARLDQEPAANVIKQKRPERLLKTMETRQDIYGRIEDGRQSRKKKSTRSLPQNTVFMFSAEQSAIILGQFNWREITHTK